jgi:hypothetical protein
VLGRYGWRVGAVDGVVEAALDPVDELELSLRVAGDSNGDAEEALLRGVDGAVGYLAMGRGGCVDRRQEFPVVAVVDAGDDGEEDRHRRAEGDQREDDGMVAAESHPIATCHGTAIERRIAGQAILTAWVRKKQRMVSHLPPS